MIRACRLSAALALLLLSCAALADTTTQRLAALGRVWGLVKHAHPLLGTTDVRWDEAGVRAIGRTLSGSSAGDLAAATQEMLSVLGDASTRVERTCVEVGVPQLPPLISAPGVLYIAPGSVADANAVSAATHVVFDLRPLPGRCASANAAQLETLASRMFSGTITGPQQRKRLHHGYLSQNPEDAENSLYRSSLATVAGPTFTGLATSPRHTTFVVDEHSALPPVAVAMIASGQATMISVGPYRDLASSSQVVPLEGALQARIRTSEVLKGIAPRTTISADADAEAIVDAALATGRLNRRRSVSGPPSGLLLFTSHYDAPYTEMRYPAVEYRVLAAYRYWNAIEYFYPYKPLIDAWAPRLEQMIGKMMAASTQTEYELALSEMTTFVPDGHSLAITPADADLRGRAAPPFQTLLVEGKAIVTAFTNQSASAAGIRLGDELIAIDGRPIAERIAELKRYISASNAANLEFAAVLHAPRGPDGTEPLMRFRRPDGAEYETRVRRTIAWRNTPPPANVWRVLPNNIGYVDLRYLETTDVDRMFSALAGTRAIIFDMRGYPRGVFPLLARRLNLTGSTVVAQLRVPNVLGGIVGETHTAQELGRNQQPSFRGKTFLLIDERAQSQAEHTGLVLEAVAGTKFVGSPTSGSNGNVTFTVMPGGHYIMFTGMDVRHADGRQLQRIGLIPDIPVPRTIAAIAAGRDEVLEKAIEAARE